jgi:hypothetical protein
MSVTINLVPLPQLQARRRRQRCNAWITLCSAAGVLCATAGAVRSVATDSLAKLTGQLGAIEKQQQDLRVRLLADSARRTELVQQLETAAGARRPQPWAGRLVHLAREAPEGVFLTSLTATPAPAVSAAAPPPPPGAAKSDVKTAPPATAPLQAVRLQGYALDHGALLQLYGTLERLAGFEDVALVRATQEPFRNGMALAFELECRAHEGRP